MVICNYYYAVSFKIAFKFFHINLSDVGINGHCLELVHTHTA